MVDLGWRRQIYAGPILGPLATLIADWMDAVAFQLNIHLSYHDLHRLERIEVKYPTLPVRQGTQLSCGRDLRMPDLLEPAPVVSLESMPSTSADAAAMIERLYFDTEQIL